MCKDDNLWDIYGESCKFDCRSNNGEETTMTNILYNFRAFVDTKLYQDNKAQEEYTLLGTIATIIIFPIIILLAILIRFMSVLEYLSEIKIKPKRAKKK